MRPERIESFDIEMCQSTRHHYKFAVISPVEASETQRDTLIQIYINYHLAIVPNLPVILFQLETLTGVGSPLYNHVDGSKVYHLPRQAYPHIDEIVKEDDFILSHALLNKIVDTDRVYDSIFRGLEEAYNTTGLTVLGVHRETQETEV